MKSKKPASNHHPKMKLLKLLNLNINFAIPKISVSINISPDDGPAKPIQKFNLIYQMSWVFIGQAQKYLLLPNY